MNAILHPRLGMLDSALSDPQELRALSIAYLRLWAEGEAGRSRMVREICDTIGQQRGRSLICHWANLLDVYCDYQQETPVTNTAHCDCFRVDEIEFADFLAIAAEGDREDALLLATSLVKPEAVLILTNLAAQVGLSLKQIVLIRSSAYTPLVCKPH